MLTLCSLANRFNACSNGVFHQCDVDFRSQCRFGHQLARATQQLAVQLFYITCESIRRKADKRLSWRLRISTRVVSQTIRWSLESTGVTPSIQSLGNQILDNSTIDIRQAEVTPSIIESKPLVVETEQMKHGRVPIVDVYWVFDGSIAVFVSSAISIATFDSAARHPDRIALAVVVASRAALSERRADRTRPPK